MLQRTACDGYNKKLGALLRSLNHMRLSPSTRWTGSEAVDMGA